MPTRYEVFPYEGMHQYCILDNVVLRVVFLSENRQDVVDWAEELNTQKVECLRLSL
jgi:hypothetical protein